MATKPLNDTSYGQFLNERKIMGSRCKACRTLALPPRPICNACHSSDLEWVEFKGKAKLCALTSIVVAPPAMAREGFGRDNPYVVGVVELDEGVKAVARIIGVDAKKPETIQVGMPLHADFLSKGEGAEKQTALAFKA
ncbi:MAG: Zn-ribbon domain-containing OB-fold protein [Planctomycetaceae bacterium]|nr:MAG: Zn-ribbon domain-containing OB-fold protein [Planctomycetaceae bacterium]